MGASPELDATILERGTGRTPRLLRDRRTRDARSHPVRRLLGLFAATLVVATVILMLPVAAADGAWTPPLTAFFTATSALTGTGLVVVDTGTHWSVLGQVVLLALVVLGGIGIMAATGLLLVVVGRRTDLRSRLIISGTSGAALGETRSIIVRTTLFVAIATSVGAVVLGLLFWLRGDRDAVGAAWWGVFHSAMAVNNAGLDIVGGFRGFTPFANDLGVVLTTVVLMLIGSVGLVAVSDVWTVRRWRLIAVESRVVLIATAILAVVGAVVFLVAEWTNPETLGPLGPIDRVSNALFASVSARSTGMNTIDVAAFRPETQSLMTVLMFIGGAVGSTAGGIRVNTLAVLVVVVVSVLRRSKEPQAMGRRLEARTVNLALTVTAIGLVAVGAGTLLIQLVFDDPDPAVRSAVAFEVVSAFGTVGLSSGLTAHVDAAGQLILIGYMLLGRLSVLLLAILFARGIQARGGRPPRGIMRVA